MMLGTKSRYAVMAMVELAGYEAGRAVTLCQIAEAQEIPLPYLEQIFNKLKRCGLVRSVRGPGGGYMLAKPTAETWIADIVQAVDEPLQMTRCEKHSAAGCMAARTRCLTHDLWEGLGDHIFNYLSDISLQDVRQRNLPKTRERMATKHIKKAIA